MSIQRIDQLIWSIDDEEGILEYKLPNGLSIWLLMRYVIYTILLRKIVNEYKVPGSERNEAKKTRSLKKNLGYVLKSFSKNPLSINKKFDCVNICSSLACVPSAGGYKNRISGFLNDLGDFDVLNLIKSDGGNYRKRYAGTHGLYDFIFLKESIKQKLSISNKKKSSVAADRFFDFLKTKLKNELSETDFSSLSATLKNYVSIANGIERSINTILEQTSPKLVIIEDGNYGSLDSCTITMLAKQLGIKTAEIQHGVFDVGYRYSNKLINHPSFVIHKTDYILSFGDYFSQSIHSSSKNLSIGNHFLETKARESTKRKPAGSAVRILFITQGDFTDNLIPVVLEALTGMPANFELVIRLHPSDTGFKEKYREFFEFAPTEFSINDDIYDLINNADHIIGSYSFVMYECLYFGKNPLIHDNHFSKHFISETIGIRFKSAQELRSLLKELPQQVSNQKKDYYWKADSKKNFQEFYKTEVLREKQEKIAMTNT